MKCIILLFVIYGAFCVPVEDNLLQEFINGNHKFSAGVYKEILKTHSGSFASSPLSAEIIIALTNEGAKGDTSSEIIAGLSLPSTKEKIHKALKSVLPNFTKSEPNIKLLTANKIYAANNLKLDDEFQSIATNIYGAGVDNIDFSKNVKAVRTINKWVEDKTNNKIKKLLQDGDVDGGTRLILVNALYFNGNWVSQFAGYKTGREDFYKSSTDVIQVPTMKTIDNLNYYENTKLKAKFLELKFLGGDISMVIVLPNEIEGLASLEQDVEQLLAPPPFSEVLVDLGLPRFATETQIQFRPILEELGVRKLFGGGDLSGISSTDRNLAVSKVIQKVFIGVTETGVEAAAATFVSMMGSAPSLPQVTVPFKADHPFFYYIQVEGIIAFCGRYSG